METQKKSYKSSLITIVLLILFFPAGLFTMWLFTKWNNVIKLIITGFFLLLIVIGATSSKNKTETITQPAITPSAITVQPSATPTTKYVFDIPSLVSMNTDQITKTLSQYKEKTLEPNAQQIKLGVKEWDMTFKKDGEELLVSYDYSSKKVIDFFIDSSDSHDTPADKNHLLSLGNLSENDPKYKVEFVKALNDPSILTGIKVTPQ